MSTKTLSQKIEELKKNGYTANLSSKEEKIVNLSSKNHPSIDLEDIQVEEFYRFEGMTNPSDLSILYAISTKDGLKGTLVDGYGMSSSISKELAEKINM